MSRYVTSKRIQWMPAYNAGLAAFKSGEPEDKNPYGMGLLMERCAWSAGWHDARRELA